MFENVYVKVFLEKVYYGFGYLSDDFMMLDTVYVSVNDDTFIYVAGNSSNSNDNDNVIWHARLGHIGQDRLIYWLDQVF